MPTEIIRILVYYTAAASVVIKRQATADVIGNVMQLNRVPNEKCIPIFVPSAEALQEGFVGQIVTVDGIFKLVVKNTNIRETVTTEEWIKDDDDDPHPVGLGGYYEKITKTYADDILSAKLCLGYIYFAPII